MARAKGQVIRTRDGGSNQNGQHAVNTVVGGKGVARREPCSGCPWRKDQDGQFPAEAFRCSAPTAYDMSDHTFGCHESSKENPAICAGFLLRGSAHNLRVRLKTVHGEIPWDKIHDGGHDLHEDYKSMAVANGCDPDEDVIRRCR